jgi:hypothetical protein
MPSDLDGQGKRSRTGPSKLLPWASGRTMSVRSTFSMNMTSRRHWRTATGVKHISSSGKRGLTEPKEEESLSVTVRDAACTGAGHTAAAGEGRGTRADTPGTGFAAPGQLAPPRRSPGPRRAGGAPIRAKKPRFNKNKKNKRTTETVSHWEKRSSSTRLNKNKKNKRTTGTTSHCGRSAHQARCPPRPSRQRCASSRFPTRPSRALWKRRQASARCRAS